MAQVEPTFRNFVAAFRGHLGAAMSGAFSVPFYGLAVYLDNKFAQTIFLSLAFLGSWFAAYTVWRAQCERANSLDTQLLRYELDVEYDSDPKNSKCHNIGTNGPWEQFRLIVANSRSGKTIHRCKAFVTAVESRSLNRPYPDNIPLTWAILHNLHEIDLQDGEKQILNLIVMVDRSTGTFAEFVARTDAHNAPHPFHATGDYRCHITLTSDETKPKYISFTFHWTGQRSTSSIRYVKASDQPPV